jgi:hypothetical protein
MGFRHAFKSGIRRVPRRDGQVIEFELSCRNLRFFETAYFGANKAGIAGFFRLRAVDYPAPCTTCGAAEIIEL